MSDIRLDGGLGYEDAKRKILDGALASEIAEFLPTRLQLHTEWKLKYSLESNGASLRTLYERVKPSANDKQQHGYVVVIEDAKGGKLGAYVNEPLKPTEGTHFTGNGDCFLWKKPHHSSFKGYVYTGANDFILFCTQAFLSMGGGNGYYGLWLDDDLNNAVSCSVPTFDNEELSAQGAKFKVVSLEVWQV